MIRYTYKALTTNCILKVDRFAHFSIFIQSYFVMSMLFVRTWKFFVDQQFNSVLNFNIFQILSSVIFLGEFVEIHLLINIFKFNLNTSIFIWL